MNAIALYARATQGFDSRVAHATAVLQLAAIEHAGRIVQATSLGAEDMVLTDLIARHQLGIAVATLETGRLHAQTVALIPRIEAHYRLTVAVYRPHEESVIAFVGANGANAMFGSLELRKSCCQLRKLEPLSRMLAGRTAWITGLRREQSSTRAIVPFSEPDAAQRIKFNPLADWSWADVWHYIALNDVPYNPLHDAFMPSIGCEPCTRAIPVGADFRSGRWWWENDASKECGLHVKPQSCDATAASTLRSEGVAGVVPAQADFGADEVKGAPAPGRSQNDASKECGLHVKPQSNNDAPAPGRSQNDASKECGLHVRRSTNEDIGAPA